MKAQPKGLPFKVPVVSLKVALPEGSGACRLVGVSPTWTAVPWQGAPVPSVKQVVCLGERSSWRGISYQEILLTALKPSSVKGEALLLTHVAFNLESGGQSVSAAAAPSTERVRPGGVSPLFLNPSQASREQGKPATTPVRPLSAAASVNPVISASGLTTPRFRISVSRDGVFRLTYNYLTTHGLNASGVDPRNFHLVCKGVEVPIVVEGASDGSFDPGDSIVFYGQKLPIQSRDMWNGGNFTHANVYWLYADGSPGLRMTNVSAAPGSGYPAVASFSSSVHAEVDNQFDATDHFRPNGDVWFWGPVLQAPAGPSQVPTGNYAVTLPDPVSGTSVSVTGVVAGLDSGTHTINASLNGVSPTSGNPLSWTGKVLGTGTWTFGTGIQAGANMLTLTVSAPSSGTDFDVPDSFDFTYTRGFQASSGALDFTASNADATYTSTGYPSAPYILDLSRTDPGTGLVLPRRLTGASYNAGAGSVTFQMARDTGVAARRVALSSAPAQPDGIAVSNMTNLSDPSLGADLLIITTPDFESTDPNSEWQKFLARRESEMQVKVVEAQDIYDNFSYGIFDPTAIRSFLDAVGSAWAVKPKFILLMGDGTYDYENNEGTPGFKDFIPTMMFEDTTDSTYLGYYASDAWYADWNGDGFPDAAVGRLPATSFTQSEGMLQKIMAYEDQALTGSWFKNILYISDKPDTHGQEFETFNDNLASTYTPAPWTFQKIYYAQSPYDGTNFTQCASDIRAAFPESSLVSYNGHGYFTWWGQDLIFSSKKLRNSSGGSGTTYSDVDLLMNPTTQLPFVLNGTCYAAAFNANPDGQWSPALAEDLMDRSDRGAIGASGFTTIGYASEEGAFTDTFFAQAFDAPKVRTVGDLVEAGRFALPSTNQRAVRSIVLLGDPSMKLLLPAPPPPAGLSASPGNQSVSLSWTAPATAPAGYNVYRSSDGGNTWAKVNASLVTASTYTDNGLTNGTTYYYYVTSVDGSGFEGAPSTAVSAVPLNPNPPAAPTGLAATDNGDGASLSVSWNPNGESDLDHYTLYWGTSSGSYSQSQVFGKTVTSTVVGSLTTGTRYYFALSATNTSGKTSSLSGEVSAVPTKIKLAVRPPAMITDLKVVRSGSDLDLSWTAPAVDVGGEPTTVAGFEIFRNTGSFNWSLDGMTPLANLPASQTTYTDAGAAAVSGPLSYLVVALDANGDRSPASNPPPGPVLDLRVTTSAATGATLIHFSPVTTNMYGRPDSLIDHYELYGFYPMTQSADHVKPGSPALQARLLATLPPCEGTAVYCDSSGQKPLFYTAVAVDNRGNTSLY